MDIEFTAHAKQRGRERGVTEADVKAALLAPHQFLPEAIKNRRKIKAKLPEGDLIVVYAPEPKKKVIISTWWDE